MQAPAARPTQSSTPCPPRPGDVASASITQASVAAGVNTGSAKAAAPDTNKRAVKPGPKAPHRKENLSRTINICLAPSHHVYFRFATVGKRSNDLWQSLRRYSSSTSSLGPCDRSRYRLAELFQRLPAMIATSIDQIEARTVFFVRRVNRRLTNQHIEIQAGGSGWPLGSVCSLQS